jgi:hypothetical protein
MFRHFTLRFCGFPFVEIKDVSHGPSHDEKPTTPPSSLPESSEAVVAVEEEEGPSVGAS